jgi:hypothetical protein
VDVLGRTPVDCLEGGAVMRLLIEVGLYTLNPVVTCCDP